MNRFILKKISKQLNSQEQVLINFLYIQNLSVLEITNLNLSDIIFIRNFDIAFVDNIQLVISGQSFKLLFEFVNKRYKEINVVYDSPLFSGMHGRLSLDELWIITRKFSDLFSSTFTH